jgi:hypothetical protein
MDNNGYVYDLIMRVENKFAFKKYFNDFIKIAYGIRFVDILSFTNGWAKTQDLMIVNMQKYISYADSVFRQYEEVGGTKVLSLLSKYNDFNSTIDFVNKKNGYKAMIDKRMDYKYETFKEWYGGYPSDEIVDNLKIMSEDLKILGEAIDKYDGIFNRYKKASETLQKNCANRLIDCITKLKNKDWETNE